MRTNIDIDDRLMRKAMKAMGQKTKRATVEEALRFAASIRGGHAGISQAVGRHPLGRDLSNRGSMSRREGMNVVVPTLPFGSTTSARHRRRRVFGCETTPNRMWWRITDLILWRNLARIHSEVSLAGCENSFRAYQSSTRRFPRRDFNGPGTTACFARKIHGPQDNRRPDRNFLH